MELRNEATSCVLARQERKRVGMSRSDCAGRAGEVVWTSCLCEGSIREPPSRQDNAREAEERNKCCVGFNCAVNQQRAKGCALSRSVQMLHLGEVSARVI